MFWFGYFSGLASAILALFLLNCLMEREPEPHEDAMSDGKANE
jgi:hypothetical protein